MTRVLIECGDKKVFASALDWPGWSRSGTSEEDALAVLERYASRYQRVVEHADLTSEFEHRGQFDVVQRLKSEKAGQIDFGIPITDAEIEFQPTSFAEYQPLIRLLEASWKEFDDVTNRVSAELQKGSRGGGRNRDQIVDHVLRAEESYFTKLGVPGGKRSALQNAGVEVHRAGIVEALLEHAKSDRAARSWSLRYLIRRAVWHVLDHTWEMEDKDLTNHQSL